MLPVLATVFAATSSPAQSPAIGAIDVMPTTGLYAVTFHDNGTALQAVLETPPEAAQEQCLNQPVALRPGGGIWTLRRLADGNYTVSARARCEQSGPIVFCDTGRRYVVIDGGPAGFALENPTRLRVFHACTGRQGLWHDGTVEARMLDAAEASLTGG